MNEEAFKNLKIYKFTNLKIYKFKNLQIKKFLFILNILNLLLL